MTDLRLSQFLPYRLSILSNRLSNVIARAYRARFGLSVPEWRIIAVLAEFGEMTARDIAAATQMDKVSVSRAVARLKDRDLVTPTASPQDRRSRILRLTEEGQAIFNDVAPMARQFEADLLSELEASERQSLDRILDRLGKRLETLERDGA